VNGSADPDGSMIGRTVSHYRIVEKISGGGMGVVYKAQDTRLERTVALKFLPSEWCCNRAASQRLMREARAASALDHPNICTIHDVGETAGGQVFIVMAYYPGVTIASKIEQAPLSVAETVDVGIQILAGLSQAHQRGIIHRDIKPANLIVTEDGVAKILDFGLAKLAGVADLPSQGPRDKPYDASDDVTRTGGLMGTPAYMSPEQLLKENLDQRTDIWSVGVCLYEAATGQRPFRGDYPQAVVAAILREQPEPVSSLPADAPQELERVLLRAMAKSPDDRYQEAHDMLRDLQSLRDRVDPFAVVPPPRQAGPSVAVLP
jgi:serine/threonine protein kinase